MNCRYVARPFAMIGARSSGYIVVFFLAASRSREQIRKLPISHPILTSAPGTAALQNCESSSKRAVPDRLEEPSPESNDLAMSRLRTRETIISPCVSLAPSLNVRTTSTRKKRNCCTAAVHNTVVIAHGFWAHIGFIPWATSNRQTSQLALRRGASRTARNLFTPLPYRL